VSPFDLSKDTWGLIAMGVLITVLWLWFRRIFPDDTTRQG
jgi:hypothetical protein